MSDPPLALITGAAHRLGKVFAVAMAQQGFAILLHYHSSEAAATRTAQEIFDMGVPVFLKQADLRQPGQITELFAYLDTLPHPIKVLINSAARMNRSDATILTQDEWDEDLALNLRAPFLCAQKAAARMEQGGLIVNVTDVAAQKSWHAYPTYTVSKSGLEALTKVLARAFAPSVRVNAIAPGLVLHSEIVSVEQWEKMVARLPLKRSARIEEVASALEFLVKNEYVTGQTIVVDGGYSLI